MSYLKIILISSAGTIGTIILTCLAFYLCTSFRVFSYEYIIGDGKEYVVYINKEDISFLVSSVTSFYSTIITLLICLLTVVSALAFVVIRASASDLADKAAKDEVQRFIKTEEGQKILLGAVKPEATKFFEAFNILINELEENVDINLTTVSNSLNRNTDEAPN